MTHINAEQRQSLAASLQARRQLLEARLQGHQTVLSRVDDANDMLEQDDDAPQRANERELDQAISGIESSELSAITRALKRVNDPEFGLCIDCGCEIPLARLQIEPETLRCVACQSRLERKG